MCKTIKRKPRRKPRLYLFVALLLLLVVSASAQRKSATGNVFSDSLATISDTSWSYTYWTLNSLEYGASFYLYITNLDASADLAFCVNNDTSSVNSYGPWIRVKAGTSPPPFYLKAWRLRARSLKSGTLGKAQLIIVKVVP